MSPTTTTSPSRSLEASLTRYLPWIERTASRYAGNPGGRPRAEYDDLVQEGLIAAWLSLQRGVNPAQAVENRMRDWIRYLARQPEPIPYDTLLPMESLGGVG